MNKLIAIIAGEPNSISSEIIFKSWKLRNKFNHKPFFVIGSIKLLNLQKKKLNYNIKLKKIDSKIEINNLKDGELPVFDVDYIQKKPFEKISNKSNKYIFKCFDVAVKFVKSKKIIGFIKLQIQAGQANPAPPVGPALGQQGVNIMDFCKAFNAETQDKMGDVIPVEITVYADRSFSFITKTPPAARLILKAANIPKGSGEPNREKVGSITENDLRDIAEIKMKDLNANTVEQAMEMVRGTARSMGVEVNK